jgi:hypothetical protein
MTIAELKPYQDKTVVLRFWNGEVATVKVDFVDAEYEDIIVDVISTNRRDRYTGPSNSVYAIPVANLASVEEISN